ncbi:uncharacterized protein NPIL_59091 [Nephila pilipes]|uniref:Uncharacterized protein n=1 Tax=Nephila pilipes TaxID=299642 RepID=A0A8X6MMR2_NEPPI|nr:uncharacterized protein NPIL_59091 [Nephila pilipes]
MPEFRICLDHALSKVIKSHVLVQNTEPFVKWKTIRIDNNGFPHRRSQSHCRITESKIALTNILIDQFLVAHFSKISPLDEINSWRLQSWAEDPLIKGVNLGTLGFLYSTNELNLSHESAWRRVYSDNEMFYLFEKIYISSYLKDQFQRNRPVNVVKQIMKRERNELFNQFEILNLIASPYYYVLPHQDEQKYAEIQAEGFWLLNETFCNCRQFTFQSTLDKAMKGYEWINNENI